MLFQDFRTDAEFRAAVGTGATVLFARLGAGTALTAADFIAVAPTS